MKIALAVFLSIVFIFANDVSGDKLFWDEVKDSNSIELLKLYKKNYPDGTFVPLADHKIKLLFKSSFEEEQVELEKPLWLDGKTCKFPFCGFGRANKHFKGEDYQKSLAIKRADRKLFDSLKLQYSKKQIEKLKSYIQTKIYTDKNKRVYILRFIDQIYLENL